MRKNFALVFLILLTTFSYDVNANRYGVGGIAKEHVEVPTRIDSVTTIRLPDQKKTKITKKELKDEIKRRKKYHKTLVTAYNENFDPEYLSLIEKNSRQLTDLRELLQT